MTLVADFILTQHTHTQTDTHLALIGISMTKKQIKNSWRSLKKKSYNKVVYDASLHTIMRHIFLKPKESWQV